MTTAAGNSPWSHPSCEDALIDFLIENPDKRMRYLECCNKQGLLGVLTVDSRKRWAPLVASTEDWKLINDKTTQYIETANMKELIALTNNLLVLYGNRPRVKSDIIINYICEHYTNLVNRIDETAGLNLKLLTNIKTLSMIGGRLRKLPDLDKEFYRACDAIIESIIIDEKEDYVDFADYWALEANCRFIDAIVGLDPRVQRLAFGDERLKETLRTAKRMIVDKGLWEIEAYDGNERLEVAVCLSNAMQCMISIFEVKREAEKIYEYCARVVASIEEEMEEAGQECDYEPEYEHENFDSGSDSIEEIFSDL